MPDVINSYDDNLGLEKVEVPDEVLEKLKKVSVTTIWGELNRRGIPNTFMEGVKPQNSKTSFAGTAYTLRTLPTRGDAAKAQSGRVSPHSMIFRTVKKNQVVVIDARGITNTGVLGDIFASSIKALGGAALVTDGACRDGHEMEDVGLPMYTRATHPSSFNMEHVPADLNIPVQCANVLVMPGDVIVGDNFGCILIPQALAAEVADAGYEVDMRDLYSRDKVLAGQPLADWFPMTEASRAEYQASRK